MLSLKNFFPVALALSEFGGGTGPIFLDEVECIGSERSISECGNDGIGENDCYHDEDAGVRCLAGNVYGLYCSPIPLTL